MMLRGFLSVWRGVGVVHGRDGSSRIAALVSVVLASLCVFLGVASSASASDSCPNEALRTGPSAHLPDCRAYELVSPLEKNGGEVDGGLSFEYIEPAMEQASLNGEAVTYGSQTTFTEADPLSSMVTSQYLSRRGSDGWSTQAITPRQDLPDGTISPEQGWEGFSLYQGFSEDLSHAFLVSYEPPLAAEAPAGFYNPYVRDNVSGSYDLLSATVPRHQLAGLANTFEGFKVEYGGMSADGSHVIFAANEALTPEAVPGKKNLYEWVEGRLELVSVLPDGTPVSGPQHETLEQESKEEFKEVLFGQEGGEQGVPNDFNHVISADGARVIWSYRENISSGSSGFRIFMHEESAGGGRTVQVANSGASYWTASAEGTVFFTEGSDLNEFQPSGVGGCGAEAGCTTALAKDVSGVDSVPARMARMSISWTAGTSICGMTGA